MAVIGQQLTAPEEGWKRIDNTDSRFIYAANWNNNVSSSAYGGSYRGNNIAGYPITFRFKGTKFRIIGEQNASHSANIEVSVDGVVETYSNVHATQQYQTLAYEKTGLKDDYHVVTITNREAKWMTFDALDIGESEDLSSFVGNTLEVPELGWKRYDDTDPAFTYKGTWLTWTGETKYGGSNQYSATAGNTVEFAFTGTKMRIISTLQNVNPSSVLIEVDGKEQNFSLYGPSDVHKVNVFEVLNLPDTEHYVKITVLTTGKNVSLDAVDVGENNVVKSIPVTPYKYLIKDGADIKYLTNTGVWTVLTGELTQSMFDTYGMNSVNISRDKMAQLVSDNIELLFFTGTSELTAANMSVIPNGQVSLPTSDIDLKNVDEIVFASLNYTGRIGIVASIDSGEAWKSFVNEAWVDVDIDNIEDVASKSIEASTFVALSREDWNTLFGAMVTKKIRFAYYMNEDSSISPSEVDELGLHIDMKGRWRKMVHGRDYKYKLRNNSLIVQLFADGDIKINY